MRLCLLVLIAAALTHASSAFVAHPVWGRRTISFHREVRIANSSASDDCNEVEITRRVALVTAAALAARVPLSADAASSIFDSKIRSLVKEFGNNKNTNGAPEKHIPVVEVNGDEVTVTIPHVMDPDKPHYIQYVWLTNTENGKILLSKGFLATDESPPTLTANVPSNIDEVTPMCFCNLHGLWEGPSVSV